MPSCQHNSRYGEKYGDLAELEAIFIRLGRVTFIVDDNTGVEASSGKFGKEWKTFRACFEGSLLQM